MKRRLLGLTLAVTLALIGTALLVAYAQSARSSVNKNVQTFPVLVADKPIARGTAANSLGAAVRVVNLPTAARAADSVSSLASLGQRVANVDILAGEQLLTSRFTDAVTAAPGTDGKLQITIPLGSAERALGGRIKVGDTVALVATLDDGNQNGGNNQPSADANSQTHILVQKAPVVAVQAVTPPKADANAKQPAPGSGPTAAPTGGFLVTLALDAPDVERVVFAAEHGKLWLSQEPMTAAGEGTRVVTRGNVF